MKFLVIWFCIAIVVVSVSGVTKKEKSILAKTYDISAEAFTREYIQYVETGIQSSILKQLLMLFKAPPEIRRADIETLSETKQTVTCALCKSAVDVLLKYRREGRDLEYMSELAVNLCVTTNIQPEAVCKGMVDKFVKVLLFIVDERESLSANTICGLIFQGGDCALDGPDYEWEVDISPTDDIITAPKDKVPVSAADDLTIVHISDIHFDPLYKVGSYANCPEPLCCRRTDVKLMDASEGAGFWGDYRNCDAPLNAVENALDQIVKEHKKIDYVYYTGDYIDHAVWSTSVEYNKDAIHTMDVLLKEKFKDIPVYPVIGNHEPDPLNLFAPDYIQEKDLGTSWLYDFLAEDWSLWLPESAQNTIQKGGYYTVSPRSGFRIITINNNDCYTMNFWLLFDSAYTKNQLQWLHDTLLEAEKAGEFVHILAHIPTGSGSCHTTWSREFRRIVDRFNKIISAIFNGHTHKDHFSVYFSKTEPSYPVSIAWNGGSVTPYSNVNPNYRVMGVETETYHVAHHETWILNLTLANLMPHREPVWVKEYTFKDAYGITDLSPAGLDKLLYKFANDKSLLRKYWAFLVKLGDPSLKSGCDNQCLKGQLCNMATTQANDRAKCDELLSIFSENFE